MAATVAVTREYSPTGGAHQNGFNPRFLRTAPALQSLKETEFESLVSLGWCYRAARGQIIYCEGESLKYVYLIESGSVKLIRNSLEGKELIVGLVGPRECFGSWTASRPAPSLAQAIENSVLFLIPAQVVRRLASTNSQFAFDLLHLSEEQSVAAQSAAARMAFESVPQRLAQLLLAISDAKYGTLRFPINQTEIACLIGSSRETVCTILSRLRREGLLSIVKGRIRVRDRERLAAVR